MDQRVLVVRAEKEFRLGGFGESGAQERLEANSRFRSIRRGARIELNVSLKEVHECRFVVRYSSLMQGRGQISEKDVMVRYDSETI